MSSCIAGREVLLVLRKRTAPRHVRQARVVCPASWKKSDLLAYCRREHPESSVIIDTWGAVSDSDDPWHVALWIVAPGEMLRRRSE